MFHHPFSNAMKQEYLTRTTRQQHTLERCAHTVVFGNLQVKAINHVLMRSNKKCSSGTHSLPLLTRLFSGEGWSQ